MDIQLLEKLQNTSFFGGLNEEYLKKICINSKLLAFNKGDIIFCQGDKANASFFVISGSVSIIKENKNAEQMMLRVFGKGESFAEPAALVMGNYPASAYAASTCQLLEIKVSVLKNMVQERSDIAMRMIAHLSSQLHSLLNEFEKKSMCATKRLAVYLLGLSKQIQDKHEMDLPFEKSVLAAYLGIQPGTLSRSFKKLAEYGVISNRSGHITVKDIDQLQKYIDDTDLI